MIQHFAQRHQEDEAASDGSSINPDQRFTTTDGALMHLYFRAKIGEEVLEVPVETLPAGHLGLPSLFVVSICSGRHGVQPLLSQPFLVQPLLPCLSNSRRFYKQHPVSNSCRSKIPIVIGAMAPQKLPHKQVRNPEAETPYIRAPVDINQLQRLWHPDLEDWYYNPDIYNASATKHQGILLH